MQKAQYAKNAARPPSLTTSCTTNTDTIENRMPVTM